ncbi:MAG: hypothetical protein IPM64_14735 [Phycisphaerales bacterium]|nr:hypothetical protein [Phycisphaerales bacterium]
MTLAIADRRTLPLAVACCAILLAFGAIRAPAQDGGAALGGATEPPPAAGALPGEDDDAPSEDGGPADGGTPAAPGDGPGEAGNQPSGGEAGAATEAGPCDEPSQTNCGEVDEEAPPPFGYEGPFVPIEQPADWSDDWLAAPPVDVLAGGGSGLRRRPFLAFSFASADLYQRPDRNRFYEVLVLHYNTAPTSAASAGYFQFWENYRAQVRAVNPSAALGVYYSAITTQSPTDPSHYPYPSTDYSSGQFVCLNGTNANLYDPRPDSFGYYSPRNLADRADWQPWGPGLFGRWPFYEFYSRGWMLRQTTYLCRPVMDVANPQVRHFVSQALVQALTVEYPHANAISFDNAALLRSSFDHWPGKGQPLSRYAVNPPDADFKAYLDHVRAALHAVGGKLIVNTGQAAALAPHADYVFYEHSFKRRQTPAEFRWLLNDAAAAMALGARVIHRYHSEDVIGRLEANLPDLNYFLGAAMLVYEDGRFGFDPMLWNPAYFTFYPEAFLLPTWLGDPLGPFSEPQSGVFARRFANGAVLLNSNERRAVLTAAERAAAGLAAYGAPFSLSAKSAAVIVSDCSAASADGDCAGRYQGWPVHAAITRGDCNCDSAVNSGDHTAMVLAVTKPYLYDEQFPYCDRMSADMDGDGAVTGDDYALFHAQVFRGGVPRDPNLIGDMDCDGYITNLDINPFTLALVDPGTYLMLHPECQLERADLDGDGTIRLFDLDLFVDLLLAQ